MQCILQDMNPAYDYLDNGPSCGESAAYYRGRSAGTRGSFKDVHVWRDGCGADFKCATLLLFLSCMIISFCQMWVWNWFVSCHDGALKGKVTDEGFYNRTLAIVKVCREHLETPGKWEQTEHGGEGEDDVVAYFKRCDG